LLRYLSLPIAGFVTLWQSLIFNLRDALRLMEKKHVAPTALIFFT
jgi:hypothetical protein